MQAKCRHNSTYQKTPAGREELGLTGAKWEKLEEACMLNPKHILTVATVTLTTLTLACAHPMNKRSDAQCSLHGRPIYLVSGLNYPRDAWANWGIKCRAPRLEGVDGTEITAGTDERPAEWCGWWMRQHLGRRFGPEFNVARNWLSVGRPLTGPEPGALGIREHHVFQVVRVIGLDEVLAIFGNDHGARSNPNTFDHWRNRLA